MVLALGYYANVQCSNGPCIHLMESVLNFLHLKAMFILSNPKQPAVKKVCGPQKDYGEKRCEIQGGGQEMAVMVG